MEETELPMTAHIHVQGVCILLVNVKGTLFQIDGLDLYRHMNQREGYVLVQFDNGLVF